MKQIRMVFAVFFVLGLMVTSALAGTTTVSNKLALNSPFVVGYEGLGAARTVTLTGGSSSAPINAANVPVSYTLGQQLANGNLFNITLSGVNFISSALYLCVSNSPTDAVNGSIAANATQVGYGVPSAGATNFNLQINTSSNIPANAVLYLSSVACNVAPNVSLNVPANTSTGSYTITGTVLSAGGISIDTSAAANVVKVVSEYTSTLSASDILTIDYLATGSTGSSDGSHFTSGLNAVSLNKVSVNKATGIDMSASPNVTFTQSINLADSASWQGVSKIFTTAGDCSAANTAAANVPSGGGTVALTPSGSGAFNGSGSTNTTICIQVSGNVPLSPRTITGAYSYTASTGGIAPAGQSGQTFQTWQVNAYQAFNPYMYAGADQTLDVFNRFYNNSTQTATVTVEVFPADGSASKSYVLGTIPPNEAGLYWGSDIAKTAGLAVGTSYAARFTITAPPSMVNGVSFFKRSGGERQMPLYKQNNTNYLMQ